MNIYFRYILPFALVVLWTAVLTNCGEDTPPGKRWGYENALDHEKPQNWYKKFPTCKGKRQSPIHLYRKQMKFDPLLTDLKFTGYDKLARNATIKNSGSTVYVFTGSDVKRTLSGGGLDGTYILDSFHLHWGSNLTGSEHWADGKHYDGEIHYVHYSAKYGDIFEAVNSADGSAAAVVGTFIEVKGDDNPAFEGIVTNLKRVPYLGDNATIQNISLDLLLPKKKNFYRYDGSLTTPPCNEVVIWSIFKDHVFMSQKQIDAFKNELHAIGKQNATNHTQNSHPKILGNFRPTQPINGRLVTTNDPTAVPPLGTSAVNSVYVSLLIICGLLVQLF